MDSYILNSHGVEELCQEPIRLRKGENVIIACEEGCILDIRNLSHEFINKHLMKAKNAQELMRLLKNPGLAAKKYAKLDKFLGSILCNFTDTVPELSLQFHADDFYTGLYKTPVNVSHKQWKDMDDQVLAKYRFPLKYFDEDNKLAYLSDVIHLIRGVGNNGFLLLVGACRSMIYTPPEGIPIKGTILVKSRGTMVSCLRRIVNRLETYFGENDDLFTAKLLTTRSYQEVDSIINDYYGSLYSYATEDVVDIISCAKPLSAILYKGDVNPHFMAEYLSNLRVTPYDFDSLPLFIKYNMYDEKINYLDDMLFPV